MKPVVTPAEMGEADRRTIAAGTPELVLVERAGGAVARQARRMLGGVYGRRVVVVAGHGNNGADGVVAARRLRSWGVGVDVFLLADGIDPAAFDRSVARADLLIDALFGTGFRGALEGDAAYVAGTLRARARAVLAVDIPSGIDGLTGEARGSAVAADETVTFAAYKPGLLFEPGRSHAGRVHVAEIGIDPGATRLSVLDDDDVFLHARAAGSHKWSAAVFVVGGSTGMVGAPLLASHAASRSGATMVVCGLPGAEAAARASNGEIVARALPSTKSGALDADAADEILKDASRFHALALGPGLGRDDATQRAVRQLVAEWPHALVVDADGLNALAAQPAALLARANAGHPVAVLTPHAGEYARLAGAPVGADRVAAARDLASRLGSIVLLKGPGTVVAGPDGRAAVNRHDTPALATAGTGDVLTGVIGGLLAGGAEPFAAAISGAEIHGRAARQAPSGLDLVASDLLETLAPTLEQLRNGRIPGRER